MSLSVAACRLREAYTLGTDPHLPPALLVSGPEARQRWLDFIAALHTEQPDSERLRGIKAVAMIDDLQRKLEVSKQQLITCNKRREKHIIDHTQTARALDESNDLLLDTWEQFSIDMGDGWTSDGALSTLERIAATLVKRGMLVKHPDRDWYKQP